MAAKPWRRFVRERQQHVLPHGQPEHVLRRLQGEAENARVGRHVRLGRQLQLHKLPGGGKRQLGTDRVRLHGSRAYRCVRGSVFRGSNFAAGALHDGHT